MDTEFYNYLKTKGLSEYTIHKYDLYYNKLNSILIALNKPPLTQEIVNAFISTYNNPVSRAFIKHYLKHTKNKDIELEEMTGKKEQKKIATIPPEHLDKLRDTLYDQDTKWGLMFDLTYYGALRREEVVNIKPMDFNLEEISKDKNKPVKILITRAKFGKQRYVFIPPLLFKAILLYIQENGKRRDEKLFKVSNSRWWYIFNKACVKLGYTYQEKGITKYLYHLHSIRHTASTEWWENKVDIVRISKRLGHANIKTTMLYINPSDKKEEEEWGKEYLN